MQMMLPYQCNRVRQFVQTLLLYCYFSAHAKTRTRGGA